MPGPGEYVADRTEGITRVEDLPKAKVVKRSRNLPRRLCPQCGRSCYRHRTMQRTLHDLGDLVSERPRDIRLTYSQHHCCKCKSYFVERGYRRHRKMQKTVYRVRTKPNISARIALDMQREERAQQRQQTTHTLHAARTRKAA